MTYEERVKALAEEMAKAKTDEERARIAVGHMEILVGKGWNSGYAYAVDDDFTTIKSNLCMQMGLIPSPSETDPEKEPFTHDQVMCIECGGSGKQHEHSLARCQNCGGHGLIDVINEDV